MYIIERSAPILLTKLTNEGRKNIAEGTFNFTYYSIGDSEINYNKTKNKVLKIKDKNPFQVSFIEKEDCSRYEQISEDMENVVRLTLRNQAKDRGFFDKCIIDTARVEDDFFKFSGSFPLSLLDGSKNLNLTGVLTNEEFNQIEDEDILMIRIPNLNGITVPSNETNIPLNYMFFSIKKLNSSGIFEVDRFLPLYSESFTVNFWILPNKENAITYYSPSGQTINWNSETLEFYEECFSGDTKVWNMNQVFCDNFIGATGCTEDVKNYGSQEYCSTLSYLNLCNDCPEISGSKCEDNLESNLFNHNNKTIIHFTNFDTRNEYGEFFYIDENSRFNLCLPNIMWHNRIFSGSTTGDIMGMRFRSDTTKKFLYAEDNNIEYYDLVEDNQFIEGTPLSVGKVFPNLKILVIENSELSNVLSYKSNRTFSLPALRAKQIFPKNGVNTGILPRNKRIFLTYVMENDRGLINVLPQGTLSYLDNIGNVDRDVEFFIEDVGKFPYMRIPDDGNYDGNGFFATRFKILYQITEVGGVPMADKWNIVDFTSNRIKDDVNQTYIDPLKLEIQESFITSFVLTNARVELNGMGIYSNDPFCISCNSSHLTLGDERLLMGNITTKIGANIYKKVINLIIKEKDWKKTTNKTYSSGIKYLSEISFYNSDYEQIAVTKPSIPIPLREDSTTEIEINFDF